MPNTNVSAALATVISALPYSVTVDAPINVNEFLWWKYTAVTGDMMLGALARSSNDAVFIQRLNIYFGADPAALTHLMGPGQILQALSVPVTPGITYYFRVLDETIETDNTGLTLTLTVESAPLAIEPGFIYVPSENFGASDDSPYPGAVIDPDTGEQVGVLPIPCNERGDTDLNGIAVVQDLTTDEIVVFDVFANLEIIRHTLPTDSEVLIACNRTSGTFWLCVGTTAGDLYKVTPAGVLTGPLFHITNSGTGSGSSINTLGISRDETRAYFGNSNIQRWDLVNDVDLGLFITRPTANYTPMKEMLVLSDGTLIIGWNKTSGGVVTQILHYAADGSLLATLVNESPSTNGGRLAYAENDGLTSFWWRRLGSPDHYREVRVSDGVYLRDVTTYEYTGGIGPADGVEPDPPGPAMFGPDNSCPVWVLSGEAPEEPDAGICTDEMALPADSGGGTGEP